MLSIAIVDSLGSPYDGSTPSKRALGGSESAVVFIARELVKLGMHVTVFNDCESMDAQSGVYDGVDYQPLTAIPFSSECYNVCVVSRSVRPFLNKELLPVANFYSLWMHDTFCEGDDQVESLVVRGAINEIWTLSDWHTTYISTCVHGHRRMPEVLKRKIWVTRNGVNVYRDVDIKSKDPNAFIFNAAVSKGMETLLNDVWPLVRQRIPAAKLTVVGGAYPLKSEDVQHGKLNELITKHAEKNGVHFTGLITQREIADLLSNASFFIYPQSFPETFGISTVESLAYGTPVISGRFGAMEETALDDACYLMDYPVDSNVLFTFDKPSHVNQFVEMTVAAHSNNYLWQQKAQRALAVRDVCTWDKVAIQWKQHMYKALRKPLPKEDYLKAQTINHRVHELFNKRWSNPEEWGFYPEKEKRIQVIVPFYNNFQLLEKCIESIESQNYENYRVLLIDDASEEDIETLKPLPDKFTLISNHRNMGALNNQMWALKELDLNDDDIVVLIDGDDSLAADNNIFKKVNRYHYDYDFTYGSIWSVADQIPLIAQEYPNEVKSSGNFKDYRFPWVIPYTHLRTFKYHLYFDINHSNLRDDNGEYFRASGDTALFYELIRQCEPERIKAVKDVLYVYNDNLETNDFRMRNDEQIKTVETILSRDNPKRILIAIPTNQNIHPETFKSIYDLKVPEGYEVDFQFFYGYCIDQVRNLIAHYTIENGYDYLFSVDYDIEFSPDTLLKLIDHNVDMVTGLYIQRKPGQHILEIYRDAPGGAHYNVPVSELKDPLVRIAGCGFGCVLIKTEVLKAVGYPQFVYHHAIRAEDTISEDVDFCTKVTSKGFEIWADTTIKCRHHGKSAFEV